MVGPESRTTQARIYHLRPYRAWDAPTRWFHWINALLVLALSALGVAMLAGHEFGVGSEGRDRLERIHVVLGLAMAVNLLWRFYWASHGGRYAQWRAILPGGRRYWRDLQAYVYAFLAGHPKHYIGHNPLARLGVTVLLVLLTVQVLSGLLLVGIDAFLPPGTWLGQPAVEPTEVGGVAPVEVPWAIAGWAVAKLETIRAQCRLIHVYAFYMLGGAVILHVMAVAATELWEGGSLVSAMLTGWKSLPGEPADKDKDDDDDRRNARPGREPRLPNA